MKKILQIVFIFECCFYLICLLPLFTSLEIGNKVISKFNVKNSCIWMNNQFYLEKLSTKSLLIYKDH